MFPFLITMVILVISVIGNILTSKKLAQFVPLEFIVQSGTKTSDSLR